MAPGVNIYGQSVTPSPPYNVVQVVRNFQTPMNHAYNLTIEQELSSKTAFSVAYVGTKGRDLVNWRDLNACPVSTLHATQPGSHLGLSSLNTITSCNSTTMAIPTTTACSSPIKCVKYTALPGR